MKPRHPSHLRKHLWPLAAMLLTVSLPSAFGLEALLTDDSTIYSGSSAGAQGDDVNQLVNSSNTKCSVLRFEITSLLPTSVTADNVATATLRLFNGTTAPTGTGSIDIHTIKASKSWNEGNAAGVWVSGTDYDSTPVLSGVGVANFSEKGYTALDVTSAVKGWITTPGNNNGFIIRPSGTIGLSFQTKEAGTNSHNATLEITLKGDIGEVPGLQNTIYGIGALTANTTGLENVAIGYQALTANVTGVNNTAVGHEALLANVSGLRNTAVGWNALHANVGSGNVAVGDYTLFDNTQGFFNVALGSGALFANTTGGYNVGVGTYAAANNKTGFHNVAVGFYALDGNTGDDNIGIGLFGGANLTTGSGNIAIGFEGVTGASNTIWLGRPTTHTATYIAGIAGATAASGVAVYIDANGQLGTLTSSARFKRDISNMDASSEAILSLRPVSFHYKEEIDSQKIPQYGLIAEEVAKIAPDLVARDAKGEIYTVRYEAVNAMLLNEFQKEHQRVKAQEARLSAQEQTIARQQEQIQKLSESMAELNRRLPQSPEKN